MKVRQQWWWIALAALALAFTGCSNDSLDDGDSADVLLLVSTADTPAVMGTLEMGVCAFQVQDWVFTMANEPKNSVAAAPFNDIVLETVDLEYVWVNGALTTPPRTFGLAGVAVPVESSAPATFPPIALDDLSAAFEGATANVTLTITGRTVEGTVIRTTHQANLSVSTCAGS